MAKRESSSAAKRKRTHVMVSVRLDVAANARVAAAAALAGLDKSAYCARAIMEATAGIVIINRAKTADHGESSDERVSAETAA